MILVDTSIWSLALRRNRQDLNAAQRFLVLELSDIAARGEARIVGAIRQEVLSGIRSRAMFESIRNELRAFPDEPLDMEDCEVAARFFNQCRAVGIAGSDGDLLICAVAVRRGFPIFTSDEDFLLYAKHLPIALHRPQSRTP
ncbi:MAG: PIN domain-containing protein [Candidatus Sumerlaeota bacterium]|nr:PIN domain-containing protein [Candidatus Sumerlaeota bacterium]